MSAAAAAPASVIDASRRLEISHEPWSVHRLTSFYEPPTDPEAPGTGRLYLPRHQRVWSWEGKNGLAKQRNFIDSILHNYPIPTIILNAIDDGHRERWQIYDGRHRVETLWRFVNNRFCILLPTEDPDETREVYFRDLSVIDSDRFNARQIPVAVTRAATPAQLADVFVRLNSGKPLTNKDFCWASRDTPLIRQTQEILDANKERFRPLFGGTDIAHRNNLPDWVGLFTGLVTSNAGNMTTSFERLQEHLETSIPVDLAMSVMEALYALYSQANAAAPVSRTTLKRYRKIGFINAFFLNDWLAATDKASAIANWVRVITHIRTTGDRRIVSVEGAQNLNSRKISVVQQKVQRWLTTGHVSGAAADSFSDDTSDED